MKYFFIILVSIIATLSVSAQNIDIQYNRAVGLVDSTARDTIKIPPVLDSSLVGVSVFKLLDSVKTFYSADVTINQPFYLDSTFVYFVEANAENRVAGYRIRIFFKNSQSARVESEELEMEFKSAFPLIPTYRSYTTPYFKISVGNYRTKSDAMQIFSSIKKLFPNAIIVKDYIGFPALD